MHTHSIAVSAPGRICLFGEHQDYLGLPVITMAIDLRIHIEGRPVPERHMILHLPDIGGEETFAFPTPVPYVRERDYFRSGLNVLLRRGLPLTHGYECTVHGRIPINSGTSSSSALTVAWIGFLLHVAKDEDARNPAAIASLAHAAEVLEFHEPGGMMDHFASSYGGLLHIDFTPPVSCTRLDDSPGTFVLGDSREPKDTQSILRRVKTGTLEAMAMISARDPSLSIRTLTAGDIRRFDPILSAEQRLLLSANIENRGLTEDAKALMGKKPLNREAFGALLTAHQKELRDGLRISTPKIDRMIDAAMSAGALGAKINGSGGGGCMFAYAPVDPEEVAEAIERAGGAATVISAAPGFTIETREE